MGVSSAKIMVLSWLNFTLGDIFFPVYGFGMVGFLSRGVSSSLFMVLKSLNIIAGGTFVWLSGLGKVKFHRGHFFKVLLVSM